MLGVGWSAVGGKREEEEEEGEGSGRPDDRCYLLLTTVSGDAE